MAVAAAGSGSVQEEQCKRLRLSLRPTANDDAFDEDIDADDHLDLGLFKTPTREQAREASRLLAALPPDGVVKCFVALGKDVADHVQERLSHPAITLLLHGRKHGGRSPFVMTDKFGPQWVGLGNNLAKNMAMLAFALDTRPLRQCPVAHRPYTAVFHGDVFYSSTPFSGLCLLLLEEINNQHWPPSAAHRNALYAYRKPQVYHSAADISAKQAVVCGTDTGDLPPLADYALQRQIWQWRVDTWRTAHPGTELDSSDGA